VRPRRQEGEDSPLEVHKGCSKSKGAGEILRTSPRGVCAVREAGEKKGEGCVGKRWAISAFLNRGKKKKNPSEWKKRKKVCATKGRGGIERAEDKSGTKNVWPRGKVLKEVIRIDGKWRREADHWGKYRRGIETGKIVTRESTGK